MAFGFFLSRFELVSGALGKIASILMPIIYGAVLAYLCLLYTSIPIAMRGVKYKPMRSDKMLLKNMGIYGVGGVIVPFIGIKIIDVMVSPLLALLGL